MTTAHPDDDPMLEVLLTEILGGNRPPDLSAQILGRHDGDGTAAAPTAAAIRPRPKQRRAPWLSWGAAATLAALAASAGWLMLLPATPDRVALPGQTDVARAPAVGPLAPQDAPPDERTGHDAQPPSSSVARQASDGAAVAVTGPSAADEVPAPDAPAARSPLTPTPMEMAGVPFGDDSDDAPVAAPQPLLAARPHPPRKSADEIVLLIDTHLNQAWQSLGVQPADAADAELIASRLEGVIGVSLPPEQVSDIDAIRDALRSPRAQQHAARLLSRQLLGGTAWSRMEPASRRAIVTALADAIAGQRRADRVLAGMLLPQPGNDAEQAASQAWLAALGGKSPVALVEQTGYALLDLDVRCGRCHDHPNNRRIRQSDYWSMAAALRTTQTGDSGRETRRGLFYELPDGRQRAAAPAVPLAWLGDDREQLAEADRRAIANSLLDNPRLAAAMVNRLWQIVYNRPLVGVVSDPKAPPRSAHLTLLHEQLGEQLRAHDFDLGEAIAWIVAAQPMRLRPPQVLLPEQHLLATDRALADAQWQVRSFAAFAPTDPNSESLSNLLALAGRFGGGATLDTDALPTTLAQPSGDGGKGRNRRNRPPTARQRHEALLRATFPATVAASAAAMPAGWLTAIETFDQQIRHVYYAAGYGKPSQRQIDAAAALRTGAASDAEALRQLWWAMQHSASP